MQATTRGIEGRSKRRGGLLLTLALGAALAGVAAMGGVATRADAAFTEKVVFATNRTTGTGVNNPTGDFEIFRMNPDGTTVRQLTANGVDDFGPVLSPDKTKVAYLSYGKQTSNPEGDLEIYIMNASDGTAKRNLSNNRAGVDDYYPIFSPGGKKIAYTSTGKRASNPQGDAEVYVMRSLDGTGQKNLTDGKEGVDNEYPFFSSDGTKIFYESQGIQDSNLQGDHEVYRLNTSDGLGQKNLTNNDRVFPD